MSVVELPTARAATHQSFVLYDVNWRLYELILQALGDRPVHVTYDRGNLEIMTLSFGHEWWRRRIGLLIDTLAVELGMDIQGGGSTTFKREDLERGLEADECYYVRNEPLIRGKRELDLTRDPPPDLAVEIEITRSALNRMAVYAALKIVELWRFDGETLLAFRLTAAGEYEACNQSLSFPMLRLGEALQFLIESSEMSESAFVRSLREWIRSRIRPTWKNGADGDGVGQQS